MLLRWLVGNFLRENAGSVYQDAVTTAVRAASSAVPLPQNVQVPANCPIAVVFALGIESYGLVEKLHDPATARFDQSVERFGTLNGRMIRVVEAGAGIKHAERGVEDLLERGQVSWIVSAGFAGALRPELKRGDILMSNTVCDPTGESLSVGFQMDPQVVAATPYLHTGRLLTVDHVVSTKDERGDLAQKYDAVACDMESIAIARLCQQKRVRFLSVRIITDAVDDQLPSEVEALLRQKSTAAKLGAAVGAVFKRPSSVKDMWKLRDEAQRASARLAGFLSGVLQQLE